MAYCVNGGWTALGKIGAGTDTPSLGLTAAGSAVGDAALRLDNTSGGGKPWELYSTGTSFSQGNCSLIFYRSGVDGGNSTAAFNWTGNFIVGGCVANSRLHVLTTGTSNYTEGANRGILITSDAGARLILENPAASVCNNHRVWTMKNDSGRLSFGLLTDSGAAWVNENIMTMVCAGNVGINTTSPASLLHLAGGGTGTRGALRISEVGLTNYWELGRDNTVSGDFTVSGNTTERMRIATNGNVGIGTASPSQKLSIGTITGGGTATATPTAITLDDTFGNNTIGCNFKLKIFQDNATNAYGFGVSDGLFEIVSGTSGAMAFFTCGAREKMRITSGGNVGVGITTPTYKLHVNGTFYAAGSSQEYKTSICQYDTNSCMFMKLKPVTYQYKEEYKHLGKELKSETQIGLIAEEVAETYPELAILVKENDNDVVRNVDYEKLSIVLLAEVQKLRKEVDDLKTNK